MAQSATAAPARVDIWDADVVQYLLHNSFDPTTPPGWGEAAVKSLEAEWLHEGQLRPEGPSFFSRLFVTVMILIAAAALGLQHVI